MKGTRAQDDDSNSEAVRSSSLCRLGSTVPNTGVEEPSNRWGAEEIVGISGMLFHFFSFVERIHPMSESGSLFFIVIDSS